MILLNIFETTLPLTNPVLKFLVILIIILVTPIVLNKFRVPHILGLILAGSLVGPHGLNILLRDSGIILSGTAGLLYIMFLAGLEIDLLQFKRNAGKSLVFGMYTFLIPMAFGIVVGLYVLNFSVPTSVLLASMFASHTLIAYPILSKFGVARNRAVNVTVGGTMITDTLALLVLAMVVGSVTGEVSAAFWLQLSVSVVVFGLVVLFVFPVVTRWFLKRHRDNTSQFIFMLVMLFLGAFLAEAAGIEAIVGALLSGFALNRLIPATSPLMNRIEFVGNAIFIPFFLIGVGMLLDFRAFFTDAETIKVALVMTVAVSFAKFLAAWLTQKTFRFNRDERNVIFGLSNAHAAVTLAAVSVGYAVIIGYTPSGEPIRLLSESILNGTIIMILITCTIATFVVQSGARNLSLKDSAALDQADVEEEKFLIPLSNEENAEELIALTTILKSEQNKMGLYALNIVNYSALVEDENAAAKANKILAKADVVAASTDTKITKLLRYDQSILNGINAVIKENSITDLVLGLHIAKDVSESFFGDLTESLLPKCYTTTFVYKPVQPIATLKRHVVFVPENAELEFGFPFWLVKVWNISRNTGSKIVFYANENTLKVIREINEKHPVEAEFISKNVWTDFAILAKQLKEDDNLVLILSRENYPSYHKKMKHVAKHLNQNVSKCSVLLVFPEQFGKKRQEQNTLNNPSLIEPIQKLDEIRKNLIQLFRRR